MHPVVVATLSIAAVAGCGRLDFDARADGGPPATGPAVCDPVDVGAVSIVGVPLSLRAVPGGGATMAVLIGTDAGNIYAVRVTAQRVVESMHLPLVDSYVLHGAGEVGGNVFVHADFPPNDAYLKRLDPSWDTYGTADGGAVGAVDPPLAPLGADKAAHGIIRAGELVLREIDPIGNTLLNLGSRPAVGGSLVSRAGGAGARIAADVGNGTCLIIDYPANADTTITDCSAPRFPAGGDGAYLLHRRPGVEGLLVRDVDGGTTRSLDGDRFARAAVTNGALWVASLRDTQPMIAVLEGGGFTEATAAFAAPFDFGPSGDLFWLDGGMLHAARTCVR